MAFTAKDVMKLREMTSCGMMDCKKALTETDGDMDKAVEILREKGLAKAAKKADRIAAEGIAKVASSGNTAVVVEVNSETDFVAKNESFQEFVQAVADKALEAGVDKAGDGEDVAGILGMSAELTDKVLTIGEKLSIRRFEKATGDCVASYIHSGGRIGVLVAGNGASDDAAKEALTNVAMQVAAMNPQYVSRTDISAEELERLREITIGSALNDTATLPKPILNALLERAVSEKLWSDEDIKAYEEQKNNKFLFNFLSEEAKAKLAEISVADRENTLNNKIFAGLIEGRISKQLKEICLLDQTYVKAEDGKQSVAQYLNAASAGLSIAKIVRFEVGEGMAKREDNFADEVASMMK